MRRLLLVTLLLAILTGCAEEESLWEHTAPTLAPTVSPLILATPYVEAPLSPYGMNNSIAAALPPNSSLPPVVMDVDERGLQTVQITLSTGETVIGYIYQTTPDDNADPMTLLRSAGVLLLGQTDTAWGMLPDYLLNMGYTVFVLNVGELGVADFHNVFNSLQVTPMVDPGAMAVIGFGSNADVALLGCSETLGCDALGLFNPSSDDQLVSAIRRYSPRPVFIVASNLDSRLRLAAESLFEWVQPDNSQLLLWGENNTSQLMMNEFILENLSRWLAPILESELNFVPLLGTGDGMDLINPDLDIPFDLNLDLDLDVD